MSDCPDVGALERMVAARDTGLREHLRACIACRLVAELAEGRLEDPASAGAADCARFEILIAERGVGQLGPDQAHALDGHLARCESCREVADLELPADRDGEHDQAELPFVDPGAYVIGAEIARGGMGRIVSARDLRIGRTVAVKELLEDRATSALRFEREARVTGRLQHPGIVPIYELGRWPSGKPFYAMKRIEGRTLREAIRAARDPQARMALVPVVRAVAEAVAYAHSEGVIHRDLTPSNVVLGAYGETVVIDWGLAKDVADPEEEALAAGPYRARADGGLTMAGAVLGTAAYMPPEQARGRAVDARADVYAIGAILYHVLSGKAPYRGDSGDVLAAVEAGPPPRLSGLAPAAPRDLVSLVERAMARDPADRFPSAGELVAELARFQTGQLVGAHDYSLRELTARWLRRHRAATVATVLALVAISVIGVVAVRRVLSVRARATRTAVTLLVEQGREELLAGRPERAAVLLSEAYSAGDRGVLLRALLPRALDALEDIEGVFDAGHPVEAAALSADATRIAAADGHGVIDIWSLSRGTARRERVLRSGDGTPVGFAFSPDGRRLAASSSDGTVRLWDLATGTQQLRFAAGSGARVAWSPDGDRLLTSSRERGVLWDTASGRQLASQPARVENGSGDGLAFSPDGTIAAIAVAGSVHLWSRDGGSLRRLDDPTPRTDDTDTNYLDAVAFSPDGQRLAAVATAHSVSLWSLATAGEPTTLEGAPAYAIQFSSSGHSLIGGGFDDAVQISADDGEVMRRFAAGLTMAASMSPDRRWVTTVDSDRIARVWDTEAGTLALLLDGQITLVPSRDSGPSDRVLSRAGTSLLVLRVLPRDPDTGPEPPRLLGATFLPDGSAIGDTGDLLDRDGVSSRALHVAPRGPPEPLEPGQRRIVTDTVVSGIGPGGHLGHVAASRDGRVVALADFRPQAEVRWWSLPAGRSLGHHALNGAVHDVAVSPDGRWIAATDEHGAVLIDASSRQVLRVVPGAVSVEFTPDGRELITSGEGGTVWRDLVNGETRRTRPEHGRIAVRSDGAVLITGGTCTFVAPGGETLDLDQDSSAQGSLSEKGDLAVIPVGTSGWVWDVRARRPIATLTGHAGVIHQAAFAPDGERVATAGADGTVRVWESRTGRLLQTSATTGGPMIGVAFSPDGTRLLAVALDGPARMLDVHLETREADEVARLVRARGVWQVDDGRLVARTR